MFGISVVYGGEDVKITRQDGTVLNIRPASGPPPWAGGPERRANRQGDFPPINSVSR
jgi:hypothetical protein